MRTPTRPQVPLAAALMVLVAGASSAAAESQTPVAAFSTVFIGGAVVAAPVLYLVVRDLRRRRTGDRRRPTFSEKCAVEPRAQTDASVSGKEVTPTRPAPRRRGA